MSKYIIDVGEAYVEYICGKGDMLCLPVRINEFEDNWLNTNIPLTPYTEPDLDAIKQEEYEKGYKTAKVQCNIQAEKDLREVGERHYQKGYQDATVKISSDEQAIAEEAYQRGLNDAWEVARKIYDISQEDRLEIFPEASTFVVADICDRYSASEAIDKIRQYEQGKEEQIQVGDEVILDGRKYVVLVVDEDGIPEKLLEPDGCTLTLTTDVKLPKTGRHYPQIAEVLAKMKEES